MISFAVNPRDNWSPAAAACNSCCCEYAQAVPGEVNKWRINYGPWLSGLRGVRLNCPTNIDVVRLSPPCASGSVTNQPPTNIDYTFHVATNTVLAGDVSVSAVDPESQPMVFTLAPNGAPKFGNVSVGVGGAFTYSPAPGFVGYDTFYYTTSDGVNPPVAHAVMIAVDPALPAPPLVNPVLPPIVSVPFDRVRYDGPILEFPLVVSPLAQVGEVYRMTIRQTAVECDGACFTHISCYDIHIVKC